MAKGVAKDAFGNSGTANNLSNTLTANASNVYAGLAPELQSEAAHPSGYSPAQLASMNTASQQSAGGGASGAIGAGRLYSARTRNAGGAKAAIGEGVRSAGANLSNNALQTQISDANLAQKKQAGALQQEQGLYGTEVNGAEGALGLSNQALGVANQADANNPWMKLLQSSIAAGGQAAAGAGY